MDDDYLAQQNLGRTLDIIAWLFAAIAIIIVSVRCYVRLKVIRRVGIDDWLILLTLVSPTIPSGIRISPILIFFSQALALGDSSFCSVAVHWGLGRHIQFLTPEQIKYSIKWVYLCEFFAIMSPGFGRISFALLLLGLIPPTKWRRRFLWTVISIQFIVDVGTVLISFCQCRPLAGFWDQSIEAECWPPVVQQYTGYFQGCRCLIFSKFSLFYDGCTD
jgi:hypothetical protein